MPEIQLEHRIIGRQHVFTSPDLPGLYVAHADYEVALSSVDSAVEMLRQMAERRKHQEQVEERRRA